MQINPVVISQGAMEQIVALAKEDGRTGLKFRLSVSGKGCGGFQYGMRIDFVEDISGVPFVADNPNATSTCSYGSSIDGCAARMPTYAGRD